MHALFLIVYLSVSNLDEDLINTAGDQLGNDVLKLCTASIFRTMSPFSYWNIPLIGQYLDGMGFRKDRVMKLLGSYVDEYAKKKDYLDEQQRRTFLGKIFEQTKDEKSPMTREDMMGNLFSLFVAGKFAMLFRNYGISFASNGSIDLTEHELNLI